MLRRQLRRAATEALRILGDIGATVVEETDWSIPAATLPVVRLRAGNEHKQSLGRTMPEFNTVVTLEVQVAVQGRSATEAQDAVELLGDQVEYILYCDRALSRMVQQFLSVSTTPTYSAEGEWHTASLAMAIDCEMFEAFDPTTLPDRLVELRQLVLTLDSQNVVDHLGTYANPAFPDSVAPAPRSTGPDGRAEGGLNIDLT